MRSGGRGHSVQWALVPLFIPGLARPTVLNVTHNADFTDLQR